MTDFQTEFADVLADVPEAHQDSSRFVPGAGPLDAEMVLIGEAPGAREVEQGEPFVGRAGSTLDDALDSLEIDRDEVYITNVVKVRPPENRTPHVDEIEAWEPVLEAEIDRVDPRVLVPLGTTATRLVLDTDEGITAIHGQRFERDGRTVVPAYHPAATLYDRSKRPDFEEDLRQALAVV